VVQSSPHRRSFSRIIPTLLNFLSKEIKSIFLNLGRRCDKTDSTGRFVLWYFFHLSILENNIKGIGYFARLAMNPTNLATNSNPASSRALLARISIFCVVMCSAVGLISLSQQLFGANPSIYSKRSKENNKRIFFVHKNMMTRISIYTFVLFCWFVLLCMTVYFTQKEYALSIFKYVRDIVRWN